MMNRVYINGRFFLQPTTGVQRYATEVIQALDRLLDEDANNPSLEEFVCLIPRLDPMCGLPELKHIQLKPCGNFQGNLWEQIDLPFFARDGLLLNLCNIGPLLHRNQIVVFHDASVFAVPEAYSFTFKLKYRVIMSLLSHSARRIITDSHFSESELKKFLQIDEQKITVIPLGCDHIKKFESDPSVLEKNHLQGQPYLLTVGSSSPHKNLSRLIDAFTEVASTLKLVVVGGKFMRIFNPFEEGQVENVVRLGYIRDEELKALYEKAYCFIIPSYYEGFGLPPLEAMVCGCPVISSNKASLPEVCGDAALYFDPLNREEIKETLEKILSDSQLRNHLQKQGKRNSQLYFWAETGKKLLETIRSCENDRTNQN